MSACACTCGRDAGQGRFAGQGCRDRYEHRLERARAVAARADATPDRALDDLGVTAKRVRRVLAVLRAGPASTEELSQEAVGGLRGSARVNELDARGFVITREHHRGSSKIYTLVSEPGTVCGPATPAEPDDDRQPPLQLAGATKFGPYVDYEDDDA